MSTARSLRSAGSADAGPAERSAAVDFTRVGDELDAHGCAILKGLLRAQECAALAGRYGSDDLAGS